MDLFVPYFKELTELELPKRGGRRRESKGGLEEGRCMKTVVFGHGLGYHQQQNKWYPYWCLLAHFEATFDLSRSEFTCT